MRGSFVGGIRRWWLFCITLLATSGCGAPGVGPDAERVDDAPSAIVNGTLVRGNAGGVVALAVDTSRDGYWECSGVMLNQSWLLTARHCVDAPNSTSAMFIARAQPDPLVAWDLWPRTLNSYDVYVHPTEDVALVHFATQTGNTLAYANPIYTGTDQSLVGQTLTCFGYGNEERLRSANLTVTATGRPSCGIVESCTFHATGYYMPTNAAGQIQSPGDSGGPCFVTVAGVRYVTGIAHMSMLDPATSALTGHWQAGAEHFRDWVYSTTGTVAPTPCSISNVLVDPAQAIVTWSTSSNATRSGSVSADGVTWTPGTCDLTYRVGFLGYSSTMVVSCPSSPSTTHQVQFHGLTRGTYSYQLVDECSTSNALAPIKVSYTGTFTYTGKSPSP